MQSLLLTDVFIQKNHRTNAAKMPDRLQITNDQKERKAECSELPHIFALLCIQKLSEPKKIKKKIKKDVNEC